MSGKQQDTRLAALEARVGHVFADKTLLREAMTHGSAIDGRTTRRSYDRLEFLGDRVLALVVAERLLGAYRDEDEGEIAPRFNSLVNRQACAQAARAAGLGEAVILSASEEGQGGREKETILADLCESVIAALYLDGGVDVARGFITRFWGDAFDDARTAIRDAKTALQEWAAARKKALTYVVINQTGPDHAPHFVIEARVDGFDPQRGEGASKREAQRVAAAAFLAARGADV